MPIKTYHDVFVEQLIRRERPGGEFLFKCGAVLLGLILITAAFILARTFFPFFFALVVILEFFAFVYTVKEFEYSFMNGDCDIDAIQGKRRRRTVSSYSCREVALMAPCQGHEGRCPAISPASWTPPFPPKRRTAGSSSWSGRTAAGNC